MYFSYVFDYHVGIDKELEYRAYHGLSRYNFYPVITNCESIVIRYRGLFVGLENEARARAHSK